MSEGNSRSPTILAIALLLSGSALLPVLSAHPAPPKKASGALSGEAVFKQNCSGCHPGGGNVAKPFKPVANSSKLNSIDTLKTYLNAQHKPAFKQIACNRKVLEPLYQFCKNLKNQQAREAYDARVPGSMN